MQHKQAFTCSFCCKILSQPVTLLCGDTICQEHLTEKNAQKEDSIKCKACNEEFILSENKFPVNKMMQNQLSKMLHLTENEKKIKVKMEELFEKMEMLIEECQNTKNELEMANFSCFQEIRRQIDLHYLELKTKLDQIYEEMIEKVIEFEKK